MPSALRAVPGSPMKRRGHATPNSRLLPGALVLGLAFTGSAPGAERTTSGPTAYEKDVDFLLTELGKQSGHFFEQKKIDWKAVEKRFRGEVKKVKSDVEHVKLCARLLAQLEDGHAGITDSKVKLPDETGGQRWTGPRVHLVPMGKGVYVLASFKDALSSGIEPGMEVLRIDGEPARRWLEKKVIAMREEGQGYSTDHQALHAACHWGLAAAEGTRIAFELRDVRGRKKTVAITRRGGPNYAPLGPAFPPEGLEPLGRQSYTKTASGFGYIHLRDVPGDLPDQIDHMLAKLGEIPGLILDMRANGGGGCDHEAVFGRFLAPGETWRQYTGQGSKPYTGPMVVIIDAGVRSAGETVAGMLKEDGRAYLIGDTPTAGMSSQKATLAVPSGLFTVRFSVHSNKSRFNGGKGIEGIGVAPHQIVPYQPADLAAGVDTLIRRAEELLKKGLPAGVVPYPGKK